MLLDSTLCLDARALWSYHSCTFVAFEDCEEVCGPNCAVKICICELIEKQHRILSYSRDFSVYIFLILLSLLLESHVIISYKEYFLFV